MAHGSVRQIEQRWSVRRTCVHDLEHRLKVAIQIHCRPRVAFEGECLIAVIPLSMWNAMGEPYGFAWPEGEPLAVDLRRQGARQDQALFILEVMNVHRWALSMRRQSAPQSKDHFSVTLLTADLQNLTRVSVLEEQIRRTRHHLGFRRWYV